MEKNQKKPEIKLVKDSKKYSLTVTKELENKIRYLCATFPNKEYSGALFYTVDGEFGNDNLKVTCRDFCLCDVGSSTYTEFETRPEVVSYMCENDLLDCYIGLLHSHDTMNTFFSGTDLDTLKSEGSSMPHFVSLIVNNKGDYTAAITSQIVRYFNGTVQESMNTFGGNVIPYEATPREFSDTCVRYNFLDITVDRDEWYNYITNSIDSILRSKAPSEIKYGFKSEEEEPLQLKLFDDIDIEKPHEILVDPKACERVLKRALFLEPSKDVSKYKVIDAIYNFIDWKKGKPDSVVENTIKKFMDWCIEDECGSNRESAAYANLCNDLTLYIDSFEYTINKKLLKDDIEDVLSMLFDAVVDLLEQ